jgi:hypothetical protein
VDYSTEGLGQDTCFHALGRVTLDNDVASLDCDSDEMELDVDVLYPVGSDLVFHCLDCALVVDLNADWFLRRDRDQFVQQFSVASSFTLCRRQKQYQCEKRKQKLVNADIKLSPFWISALSGRLRPLGHWKRRGCHQDRGQRGLSFILAGEFISQSLRIEAAGEEGCMKASGRKVSDITKRTHLNAPQRRRPRG